MAGIELTLARRLGWKPEGRKQVTPAVGVAVTGVALSMVVMLLSVAVMFGFKSEMERKMLQMEDAVTITGYDADGVAAAFNPAEVVSAISLPEGARTEEHLEVSGILKTPDDFMAVSFRSDPLLKADSLVVLSERTAAAMKLSVGDRVPAYFFLDNRLRARPLVIAGTYATGMDELDRSVARCSAQLAADMLGLEQGQVQSIGIKGIDLDQVQPLTDQVRSELLRAYYEGNLTAAYGITNIYQTDAAYFAWLGLLDTNVTVILALMSAVAAFTLISSLFIIIVERVRTIGLLKAMGAANGMIRRMFMLMGERLVFRGLLIGNVVALLIILVQGYTHFIPLNPEDYYVDFVPVKLTFMAWLLLNVCAVGLSWLVMWIPAMIVARISPATTMRVE